MTADKRADILSLARKTIHTEALALKHLEQTLGDDFVCAVELILHSRGKLVVTGMGKSGLIGARSPRRWRAPVRRVSSCIRARLFMAIWE